MMAINEVANLGWFATDRNQPEGKVCVYTFIPNTDKKRVDVSLMGYDAALQIATLSSIAATQTDEDAVRKARQQMALLMYARKAAGKKEDFFFIIDDLHDYKLLTDFRSERARDLFKEWQEHTKQHLRDVEKLDALRDEYAASPSAVKARLKPQILQLEVKVEDDAVALRNAEYEIRRIEQNMLYSGEE